MNINFKKEIYKESTSNIFTQLLEIKGEDFEFYYINDNLEFTMNNKTYIPCNFSYVPSEPEAIDASNQIQFDDVDKELTYFLQKTTKEIEVRIGLIDRENSTDFIEGPYDHKVKNIKIPTNSLITLNLVSNNKLAYKIGNSSYSNINFPGLFG